MMTLATARGRTLATAGVCRWLCSFTTFTPLFVVYSCFPFGGMGGSVLRSLVYSLLSLFFIFVSALGSSRGLDLPISGGSGKDGCHSVGSGLEEKKFLAEPQLERCCRFLALPANSAIFFLTDPVATSLSGEVQTPLQGKEEKQLLLKGVKSAWEFRPASAYLLIKLSFSFEAPLFCRRKLSTASCVRSLRSPSSNLSSPADGTLVLTPLSLYLDNCYSVVCLAFILKVLRWLSLRLLIASVASSTCLVVSLTPSNHGSSYFIASCSSLALRGCRVEVLFSSLINHTEGGISDSYWYFGSGWLPVFLSSSAALGFKKFIVMISFSNPSSLFVACLLSGKVAGFSIRLVACWPRPGGVSLPFVSAVSCGSCMFLTPLTSCRRKTVLLLNNLSVASVEGR